MRRRLCSIIWTISFVLFSSGSFAQVNLNIIDMDNEDLPYQYKRNAFKVGVFSVLWGKYGVSYERALSDLFSIETGIGLTGRNFAGNAMDKAYKEWMGDDQQSDVFPINDDIIDDDYSFDNRESELGWYVTVMPRMYFFREGIDGVYMGLNFQYKKYNFTAYQPVVPSTTEDDIVYDPSRPTIDEYEQNIIIGMGFGRQTLIQKFLIDYFFGFGLNFATGERRDLGYVNIPHPINERVIVAASEPRKTNYPTVVLEVGLQMGLNW